MRVMSCSTALLVVTIACALVACSESTQSSASPEAPEAPTAATPTVTSSTAATALPPAQPRLASDPAQLTDDLVADDQALRDASSSEAVLVDAARRQQAAYRTLARQPEWDAIARPRIPSSLLETYDHNIDARR